MCNEFPFFFFFSFFEGKKKTWRMMKFSVREVEQILNLSPRFKEDVASRGGGNVGNNWANKKISKKKFK